MSVHLVVGGSGQVGEHLLRCLRAVGQEVVGTCHEHPISGLYSLDLREKAAVAALVDRVRPEVIYLPAGLTNVDYCELYPALAYAINVLGTSYVVHAANGVGARLVYFSSDYVFDGQNGPYRETDLANPISEYGRQKLLSEHYIALHSHDYLIVRTTGVYGWESQGKNFVQRLVHSLKEGKRVRVPHDQVGSPTYAPNLAEAVIELGTAESRGLLHVAGSKTVGRYDFALAAARAFDLDPDLIEPVSTQELGQAAPRPLRGGMWIEKAQGSLKTRLLDYLEGLEMMALEQPGTGLG